MDRKLINALRTDASNIDVLVAAIDVFVSRLKAEKADDEMCALLCAKLEGLKNQLLALKLETEKAHERITYLGENVTVGYDYTPSLTSDTAQEYIEVCNEVVKNLNTDGLKIKRELDWVISMPDIAEVADTLKPSISELDKSHLLLKVTCIQTRDKLSEKFFGARYEVEKNAPIEPSACVPPPEPCTERLKCEMPAREKKKKSIFSLFAKKKTEKPVPPPSVDSVQFSAVATEGVQAGKYVPINILMYEDAYRRVVDDVKKQLGGKTREAKSGYVDVECNATVKVCIKSDDVIVEDGEEERIWNGKHLDFQFAVKVPKDYSEEQILVAAYVYINGILSVKLKLILDCNAHGKAVEMIRSDYRSAFVSYASGDRGQVAAIIQGMRKARPDLDVFFDVESLRSGDVWLEALKKEIDNRDLLFLCWSLNASKSEWVEKEWRYALENKGEESIEPIPIDTPDVCPPPPELSKKHFNDKMLFIIKSVPQLSDGKKHKRGKGK